MKTTVQLQTDRAQCSSPAALTTDARTLNDRFQDSPRMVAQRLQLERALGSPVQRQGSEEEELLQGKFDPVQRVEEEELVQGKFELAQRVEEEELLQGKFAPVQRVEEEGLLQGKFSTAQRQGSEDEELLQGKFAPVQRQGPEEEELLQGKFGAAQLKQESAPQPNNTGLPDNLKSGIESLSGLSMDHVKVHYNSPKPAQLNALAYAQGTDIHVASGQEQHLPHEAWHVVQQAQGRVRPTVRMKEGVPVNDDHGLERAAGNDASIQRKAGVESFSVIWSENSKSNERGPRLFLEFAAKFKNDKDHNPADADFRQNAGFKFKSTSDSNEVWSGESAFADDNYSRKDDEKGNALDSVDFFATDNPGFDGKKSIVNATDNLDYAFTAEQMIIDTSKNNEVIAKRGPHTATIKGPHPRNYEGVPCTFAHD